MVVRKRKVRDLGGADGGGGGVEVVVCCADRGGCSTVALAVEEVVDCNLLSPNKKFSRFIRCNRGL